MIILTNAVEICRVNIVEILLKPSCPIRSKMWINLWILWINSDTLCTKIKKRL